MIEQPKAIIEVEIVLPGVAPTADAGTAAAGAPATGGLQVPHAGPVGVNVRRFADDYAEQALAGWRPRRPACCDLVRNSRRSHGAHR